MGPSANQINREYGATYQVYFTVELYLVQIYKNIKDMYGEIHLLHVRVQRFAAFWSCLIELYVFWVLSVYQEKNTVYWEKNILVVVIKMKP